MPIEINVEEEEKNEISYRSCDPASLKFQAKNTQDTAARLHSPFSMSANAIFCIFVSNN